MGVLYHLSAGHVMAETAINISRDMHTAMPPAAARKKEKESVHGSPQANHVQTLFLCLFFDAGGL
jgi:hypothetical protein